jgi:hypothetical protein
MTVSAVVAGLLGLGLAACGADDDAVPPAALDADQPITFTTELAPLPPQATVTTTIPLAPPPTPAPAPAPTTTTTTRATTTGPPATAPGATGRTGCRAVAHIGDSTSVGMTSPAVIRDANKRLDARYAGVGVATSLLEVSGGRSIVERLPNQQNGFEVATRLRAGGFRGCWVIALGTCDAANVAKGSRVTRVQRIERMMSVIGSDPVLWVDVGTAVADGVWANRHMQAWNQDLAATLARHPNARIFRATAQMQPSWYASDGIHYTAAGSTARASQVANALAATFPG